MNPFVGINYRLREVERRQAASTWKGRIPQGGIDHDKQLVRIVLGKNRQGKDVLSPWVPVAQAAGALKIKSLPSVGQVMHLQSSTGDVQQAVAHTYNWTDDNEPPSKEEKEHVLTFGKIRISLLDGEIALVQVGDSLIRIMDGQILVQSERVDLGDEGGSPVMTLGGPSSKVFAVV